MVEQFALQWYALLSGLQAVLAGPLQALAYQWNIHALSALVFGFLGSVAPCQMTGNAAAIAYLTQRSGEGRTGIWRHASAFVWGKMAVYVLLGALAILLGFRLPTWAMALLRRIFGPLMILFALYLLRVIKLQFSFGDRLAQALERRLPGRGSPAAFGLGAAYSLAFCPTMALLFFGLLVPLSLRTPGGIVLPAFFAVGTAVPLVLFAAFLSLGLGAKGAWLQGVRRLDRVLRIVAGLVILVVGINDTVLYWLL